MEWEKEVEREVEKGRKPCSNLFLNYLIFISTIAITVRFSFSYRTHASNISLISFQVQYQDLSLQFYNK
jgi:hypothetical protein